MSTDKNLQEAFAGESQANRKYTAFAIKADKEGLLGVAKLFRAAADAETVHALAHLRVLGGIKTTAENLEAAIEGEAHEFKSMYPEFIEQAEAEGNKGAKNSFENANIVEEIHHGLYSVALASVKQGKDISAEKIVVYQVCGNTIFGEAPEKCPICGAPKKQFKEIQ